MNVFKRISYVCIVLAVSAMFSAWADEDEFALGDIDLTTVINFEHDHPEATQVTRDVPTRDEVAFGLKSITEPLWYHTKSPAGRDILYLLPHKITAVEYGGAAFSFFFNMTDNMKMTADQIINLGKGIPYKNLIALIKSFLPDNTNAREIMQLLPLFEKITLQERKNGLLIQSAFIKGPFTVQLNTSLQLGERNFWLNKVDADTIKKIFKDNFGGGNFDEREMYRILVGMGDTRLKFGLNTINMTSFQTDVGFESVLPTSRFSYVPRLTLGLAQTTFSNIDALTQSALNTLRAVRDHLIMPRLGNSGHWGVGCYVESKIGIFHDMAQLWTRISYDYLFPSDEDRLFMFRRTMQPSDLDPVIDPNYDPAKGDALINEYVRQYIFPSSFKSSVCPGGVLNFICAINADLNKRLRWALGYDFYAQQEEQIRSIYNTNIDMNDLRVEDALLPAVKQHKVYTEIFYHNPKPRHDHGIGVGGDLTVSSKNIGQDWTVYLKAVKSF